MKKLFLITCSLISFFSYCQVDSSQRVVGVNIHYGQIYVHTVSVRNVKGAKPVAVELELSRQKLSQSIFENCNCYPKKGFQFSYINFGSGILGEGSALTHFIEPVYKISSNVQFRLKGSIGLIYLSTPSDPVRNPQNNSYDVHVNPYLNLGTGISVNLNKHWNVGVNGFLHHTSNGGFKQPNRGINWFTADVSLQYSTQSNRLPEFNRTYNRYWKSLPLQFEAGIFYTPHQGFNSRLGIERNYIIGGFLQVTKQVGRISGLIAGTEVYYNGFAQHIQPLTNATIFSLQGGHVFLLGKTNVTTQIGVDLFNKTATKTSYFTRWGFSYRLNKHLRVGASLKAQSDFADFSDFRLSYIF